MLLTRFLTGIVLGPAAIALVLLAETQWLMAVVSILWLLAAREWARFAGLKTVGPQVVVMAFFGAIYACLWFIPQPAELMFVLLGLALLWWVVAFAWVLVYPKGFVEGQLHTLRTLALGLFIFVPSWLSIWVIHQSSDLGPQFLLHGLLVIWTADVFAYFAGRLLGKRKLSPNVSPGKTWEGAIGAVVGSTVVSLLGAWWFEIQNASFAAFMLLNMLVVIFSIVGDLTESMFKRHAKLKDSGTLLPGHGGAMDRLDSLFSGLPWYLFGLLLAGIIAS